MSIFRRRSLLQSQKLLRREHNWKLAKIIFVIVLIGGLIYGLSALSYSSKLNVQTVLISGNSAVSTGDILAVAHNALQGHKALVFSRANIFWYPKQQIANTLLHSYLLIDTVSINRVNLTTIAIKIKERTPVAVWCGVSQENSAPCQLMDAQGYLFAKAPEFSGAAYLKLYGPVATSSWRGAEFSSQGGLNHMFDFTKNLSEIGFQPVAIAESTDNAYNVFLSSGAYISAQISDSVSDIVANIDSLLTQKMFADSQASNFSNLLYIDTRFGNKLFYKFK